MTSTLCCTAITKTLGGRQVLKNLDLDVKAAEVVSLLGASGSGKTTLLRLIAGLDTPTLGEIMLAGKTVSTAGRVIVAPQHRGVAMVFQGLALFPHLRALDQVAFAARGREGRSRANRLLESVGLGHRANAPLDQLSGGERQRIALIRALAQEPSLLLMDEPFASLDDQRRAEMRGLLRKLLDSTETTLVLVTHSRDDALDLGRRILVLDQGHAAACDTLPGLLADPQHVAAVRCLGLGQIISGESSDGRTASTPFGIIPTTRTIPPGPVKLLVRPAQARHSTDGVEGRILSIEFRPPEISDKVRRFAVVQSGGQSLWVEVGDAAINGQTVRIRIEGNCQPLAE